MIKLVNRLWKKKKKCHNLMVKKEMLSFGMKDYYMVELLLEGQILPEKVWWYITYSKFTRKKKKTIKKKK